MRKQRNEIIRFANSELGTKVWCKRENETTWNLENNPTWNEEYIYIVNNEYAPLRKESINSERPIQVKESETGEWITPSYELEFTLPLENYRLEPEMFNYPIYKIAKKTRNIVKFISKQEGIVIEETEKSRIIGLVVGYKSKNWIEHTNTEVWENLKEEN